MAGAAFDDGRSGEQPDRDVAVSAVKDRFGKIDILVNNAGINRPAEGLVISESEWQDHFDTNVKGGFLVAQRVAPDMISAQMGPRHLHLEPVWVNWHSRSAGLLRHEGGSHSVGAYLGTRVGEAGHHGQFRGADLRGNQPDPQTTSTRKSSCKVRP